MRPPLIGVSEKRVTLVDRENRFRRPNAPGNAATGAFFFWCASGRSFLAAVATIFGAPVPALFFCASSKVSNAGPSRNRPPWFQSCNQLLGPARFRNPAPACKSFGPSFLEKQLEFAGPCWGREKGRPRGNRTRKPSPVCAGPVDEALPQEKKRLVPTLFAS